MVSHNVTEREYYTEKPSKSTTSSRSGIIVSFRLLTSEDIPAQEYRGGGQAKITIVPLGLANICSRDTDELTG
jgi:hypothetical protein